MPCMHALIAPRKLFIVFLKLFSVSKDLKLSILLSRVCGGGGWGGLASCKQVVEFPHGNGW